MESPSTTPKAASQATSPASSEDSIIHDPPGFIPPSEQDLLLTDITTEVLHSREMTESLGGVEYLSSALFPGPFPVAGKIYGLNKRLMISLVCSRHSKKKPDTPVKNIFFLVDTGSPASYLSPEAMGALSERPDSNLPPVLDVWVQTKDFGVVSFHLSPQGTAEAPGKFRDVNLLGMEFLSKFCMEMDGPLASFNISKKTY